MFAGSPLTEDLVQAATAGSMTDRDRLIAAVGPQVRAMILVRLAPTPAQLHAVDDLTQQTLLDLVQGLGSLRIRTPEGLRSFVSVIADRQVADFLREKAPANGPCAQSLPQRLFEDASAAGGFGGLFASSGLSPHSAVARAELTRRAIAELGGLKRRYREVIVLSFFDQLHIAEVADRLGMNRPAASMLLLRAIKSLRRRLTGTSKIEGGHVPANRKP